MHNELVNWTDIIYNKVTHWVLVLVAMLPHIIHRLSKKKSVSPLFSSICYIEVIDKTAKIVILFWVALQPDPGFMGAQHEGIWAVTKHFKEQGIFPVTPQ